MDVKPSNFMAWVMRQDYINRWGLTHCFKPETVAVHCHQTSAVAHLLAVIANVYFDGDYDPNVATTLAVFHEVAEVKHQDLNSASKYYNEEIAKAFKKLEHEAEIQCTNTLPEKLVNEYRHILIQKEVDPKYKAIVKSADVLCAYIKCIKEKRFGNPEFDFAHSELEVKLQELSKNYPEVKFFLDNFLDGANAGMEVIRG